MNQNESHSSGANSFAKKLTICLAALTVVTGLVASGNVYWHIQKSLRASDHSTQLENRLMEMVQLNILIQQLNTGKLEETKQVLNQKLSADLRDIRAELESVDPKTQAFALAGCIRIVEAREAHPGYYITCVKSTGSNTVGLSTIERAGDFTPPTVNPAVARENN